MDQADMEQAEALAESALTMNRNKFWCTTCCRPRIKNYCPASSHSQREHSCIPRRQLSMKTQIELYINRKFRGDGL
jgi:hypothetical protein